MDDNIYQPPTIVVAHLSGTSVSEHSANDVAGKAFVDEALCERDFTRRACAWHLNIGMKCRHEHMHLTAVHAVPHRQAQALKPLEMPLCFAMLTTAKGSHRLLAGEKPASQCHVVKQTEAWTAADVTWSIAEQQVLDELSSM